MALVLVPEIGNEEGLNGQRPSSSKVRSCDVQVVFRVENVTYLINIIDIKVFSKILELSFALLGFTR